jgi:hypothetical protein
MEHARDIFHHQPLDHNIQSIRVLHILPELTSDGYLQCRVTHTTVNWEYACLSYVWGPPEPSRTIVVNDKLFVVRQNLFDFLKNARTIVSPTNLTWIDALSIDQANISERNHQVQQMGEIYSRATCVYIWLGVLPSIPSVAELISPSSLRAEWHPSLKHYRQHISKKDILNNEYWTRAWVRQEFLLARHIKVLLRTTLLDFRDFLIAIGYPLRTYFTVQGVEVADDHPEIPKSKRATTLLAPYVRLRPELLRLDPTEGRRLLHQTHLPTLLETLRQTDCFIPRDRIYSLLSLVTEGKSIRVDYSKPDADVAYDFFRQSYTTIYMCYIRLIGHSLSLFRLTPRPVQRIGPFMEVDVSKWEPLLTERPTTWSKYQLELNNGCTHPGSQTSTVMPWPYGKKVLAKYECPLLVWLVRQLKIRVLYTPRDQNHLGCAFRPSQSDEEIQVPHHLYGLREIGHPRGQHGEMEEITFFAHGFSFYMNSSHYMLRVSLDLVWELLRDAPGEPWPCSTEGGKRCHRHRTTVGSGPWNVKLVLDGVA